MSQKTYFKLSFLSDIVLNSSANTEGKILNLDFITGSSILGMVAKKYDEFSNPFDVFHSGKIRFQEANPLINGKRTFRIPYSFFHPKRDSELKEIYNNHFVDYDNADIRNKQLKQLRAGFITSDLDYFTLDYNYEQKVAFDKEKRKSKDSTMFGLNALKKGSSWLFCIEFDDDILKEDKDKVIDFIQGEKYLGKSKQTQYGKVKIEKFAYQEEEIEDLEFSQDEISYIYVDSSLALFDGIFQTLIPNKENLALKDGEIDFANCQLRTKEITPYNGARKGYDSSRLIIEKGSIIAVKNLSLDDIKALKKGVGGYLSEGYGKVLINPNFLLRKENFKLNKINYPYENFANSLGEKNEILVKFLAHRKADKKSKEDTIFRVNDFIKENKSKFKQVKSSQWGQIRAILQINDDDYDEKIAKYLDHGVASKQWKDGLDLINDILKNESKEFLKLLSMQMPKIQNEGEEK